VKPTKENRKKFDIDLEYGTIREDKIAEMLTDMGPCVTSAILNTGFAGGSNSLSEK